MADIDGAVDAAKRLAQDAMDAHRLVGLSVRVVHRGEVAFDGSYGFADLATERPVTAQTSFRIGSITKVFTALAVVQLAAEGRLGLDDPVTEHLRAYRFRSARGARPITIRDVLTHSSGMGEYRRLREMRDDGIPFAADEDAPVAPLREFYGRGLKADTPPGLRFSYANHAFASMGQLVEDVTGRPYATYVKERILEPLGMRGADVLHTDAIRSTLAQGYHLDPPKDPLPIPYQHIVIAPAGSIHADAEDMTRFMAWVASGGATAPDVLGERHLRMMFDRHWQHDPRLPGYGLGFSRDDLAGRAVVGHDGGWPGFLASMSIVPDEGFAVYAVTNAIELSARGVAEGVLRAFLGAPAAGAPEPVTPHADAPEVARKVAGVYAPRRGLSSNARWWNEHGGEFRIETRTGGLRLSAPKGSYADGVDLAPADPEDPWFWAGWAKRLGSPVHLRLRFDHDGDRVTGFEAGLPGPAGMLRRGPWRSVRFYKPAARIGLPSLGAAALVAVVRSAVRARRRSGRRSPRSPQP